MLQDFPEKLRQRIQSLPDEPGVYQYFDSGGSILYVGKAKNLKKRVSSYFTKEHDTSRLRLLIKKIDEIKTIVVKSEADALLLENNLIKELQPRYNVNLKDDKTYPWICLKNESFPRIFPTRFPEKDGSEYFGPYASVKAMNTVLELIRDLFSLRTCTFLLSEENIQSGKFKTCLDYHIGKCKGPCIGEQTENEYIFSIQKIKQILKGNFNFVVKEMKSEMNSLSEKMEFEKAHTIKTKIQLLEKYQSKSSISSTSIQDAEIYNIISDENSGFVNYLRLKEGAVVYAFTYEIQKKLEENDTELLHFAIHEIRNRLQSDASEIVIPYNLEYEFHNVIVTIPKAGEKKQLLDLSLKNAIQFKREKDKQQELASPERHTNRILSTLMRDLRLKEEPRLIECFDNSNIQGEFAVSAMTVFRNAKPSKKDYRHFNIKSVEGPDDFASMEEVIFRRYKRVIEEKLPLPQLIVIDGGKGQLSAAMKSLDKLQLTGSIAIVGIAKRLEEIYFPNDPIPLYLNKKSETLKIIQHIRDEAHRFGITHHRKKRSKALLKTELTEIKGISIKTAEKLLKKFKSISVIRTLTLNILAEEIGISKATIITNHFSTQTA